MTAGNKLAKYERKTAQKTKQKLSNDEILVSDYGQLPAYFTEEDHGMIRKADRKLGRLMEFSGDLLENDVDRVPSD